MSRQAVDAPPARPPRYSLLIAAPSITDGARWQAGVTFAPEGCGDGGRVAIDCLGGTDPLDPADNPDWETSDAYGVWAADRCSTFGLRARDYAGRARRQLAATESFQIADEVWGGSLVGDPVLLGSGIVNANRPLTSPDSDQITTSPQTVTDGIAMVVGALGACGQGRQGMVHMSSQMLQQAISAFAVYRDSGLWYTAMGHLVVADDGYSGAGPGGAPPVTTQWIYGTSMMHVRLGEVQLVPTLDEEGPAGNEIDWPAAVDPYTNLVTVIAQRLALVEWDRCCHVAAEIAVPVPATGGS